MGITYKVSLLERRLLSIVRALPVEVIQPLHVPVLLAVVWYRLRSNQAAHHHSKQHEQVNVAGHLL
jgi:hypothetical protein